MCGLSDTPPGPSCLLREAQVAHFVSALLLWFERNARDLPWRREYTPYRVWIAEVMLSQTQVQRVVPYYERFLQRFPDVASLASAPLEEVLLLWEGLGYYRRASDLHRAAKILLEQFGGSVPEDYESLRALPGVGPYIASAILAIGYNAPFLALEANGRRVLARFFGLSQGNIPQSVLKAVTLCIPEGKARLVNQALMDFGALVCRPRSPKCSECPLQAYCVSRYRKDPEGAARKRVPKDLRIALCLAEGLVLLERSTGALFSGLFVLPWKERDSDLESWLGELGRDYGFVPRDVAFVGTFTHAYTRYKVRAEVLEVLAEKYEDKGIWVPQEELLQRPFPSLFRKALRLAFPGEYATQ